MTNKFSEIRNKRKENNKEPIKNRLEEYIHSFTKQTMYRLLIQLLIAILICILIIGTLSQLDDIIWQRQQGFFIGLMLTNTFTNLGSFIIIFILANIAIVCIKKMFKRESIKDDRDFNVSKSGIYGTANVMSDEIFKQTFDSKPVEELEQNIIGINPDKPSEVVGLKKLRGVNDHKIAIGSSGSKKTRARVIIDIMQYILRGESCVAVDPKGEVHVKTRKMAEAYGYEVKVLNLKPSELENSDGWNILACVGNNPMKAQTVSELIIKNTNNGQKEDAYFAPGAKSLLTASILFTTMNEDLRPEERTIDEMYKILSQNNVTALTQIFKSLDKNHPARLAFATFDGGSENGKASIWQGLMIRLQTLQNPTLRKILSKDEISLTECGKKPCIYYLVVSDQESTLGWVLSLFINLFFIQIIEFADKQPGQELPVPVNVEMDELPSIGVIPDLEKKSATVRSRGVILTFIIQNLLQLESLYKEKTWKTILSNCSTQIVLAVNEDETAELYSKRSGEMTVDATSKRYNEHILDPLKIHPNYYATQGFGRRYTYDAYEIMTMNDDEQLVVIQGRPVKKMLKFDYSKHPLAYLVPEKDDEDYENWFPHKHIPAWRANEERADALKEIIREQPPATPITQVVDKNHPISIADMLNAGTIPAVQPNAQNTAAFPDSKNAQKYARAESLLKKYTEN